MTSYRDLERELTPKVARPSDSGSPNLSTEEDVKVPDFEGEMSAEEYFNSKYSEQVRGSFRPVEMTRWDHDEADWRMGELEPGALEISVGEYDSNYPTKNENAEATGSYDSVGDDRDAFELLRAFALQRRWLGLAAALEKASSRSKPITKREASAIEYVLMAASAFGGLDHEVEAVRKQLLSIRKQPDSLKETNSEIGSKLDHVAYTAPAREEAIPARKVTSHEELSAPNELSIAASKVHRAASKRGWLSPKSSRALAKICEKGTHLDRSERNALNYLLERCLSVSEIKVHAEILRKANTE